MTAGRPSVRLLEASTGPLAEAERGRWASVVSHTHTIRSHECDSDETRAQLLAWCRKNSIDAVGLGSPWEPVSAASYRLHEGAERDRYYAGLIDPQSVMDREEVQALFDFVNGAEGDRALFYQDNETPKGRLGHLWYFGFRYLVPAWHDYSQDRPVQYCDTDPPSFAKATEGSVLRSPTGAKGDPPADVNSITGEPHRRRSCLEVVHEQRRAGALGVWAHPTSWWWQEGEGPHREFVTNIAAEMAMHLLVDGFLDGLTVMGYDACHRWYQKLWFRLLDTGAIVPGFAETDTCFDRANLLDDEVVMRNFLPVRHDLNVRSITAAARRGECFASTGAPLRISVDGAPMGGVVETAAGRRHRVRVEAYPWPGESALSRVDIVGRGGEVLFSEAGFPGGVLELEAQGRDGPAYLLARAFALSDDPAWWGQRRGPDCADAPRQQDIRHMAITNPVYLHPPGFRFEPALTDVSLEFRGRSPWLGGRVEFGSPEGDLLESRAVKAGAIRTRLQAGAKVFLTGPGGEAKSFYPAVENERVQAILRYLCAGEFLGDHPGLAPGEVPPEAFRIDELRAALRSFTRVL